MPLIMLNKKCLAVQRSVKHIHTHTHNRASTCTSHFQLTTDCQPEISYDSLVFDPTHFVRIQLNCILMELKYGSLRTNEKIQCTRFIRNDSC